MPSMEPMEVEANEVANITPEQKLKAAEAKKLEGNDLYKKKSYKEALELYTEAIELCPSCAAFYGNRSATLMMLYKFNEALDDARNALSLDPNFVKGYLREAKCHLSLGNASAAVRSYNKALELEPQNNVAKTELQQAENVLQLEDRADVEIKKGDYRTALFCIDRCIQAAATCVKYKLKKAELLARLGRYQESQESANDILRADSINADAIFVRGLCLYYQDSIDKAFAHFQQVLRLAPDHKEARDTYKKAKALKTKKEEGNQSFRSGKYEAAYSLYTEALEIDPNNKFTNSKLYNNRATVLAKQTKLEEAIEDCSKAIELDDGYLKAYLRRAKCYMDVEQYEEAVRDYEKVSKMDQTRENKDLLQKAKLELKKSKRKDFYKILGVSKNASDDEIKKAYRKRALLHHPDRHSHDSLEKQKEEEKTFKEIGEAYGILSDPKKKARFDSGADLDETEGFHDIDPNTIFQTFFGGGGVGGHHGFHTNHGGGFPGGFSFQFG